MSRQNLLNSVLSGKSITLWELAIPLRETFVSGIGTRKQREALIVQWEGGDGVSGFGECSCRPDPYYSAEFTSAAVNLIERFVVPGIVAGETFSRLMAHLDRIRGWHFTKAAIEAAAIDWLVSRSVPHHPLTSLDWQPLRKVPVGISIGLIPDAKRMDRVVRDAIDAGYHRLKFKIAPEFDLEAIQRLHPLIDSSGAKISFDANGSLRPSDLPLLFGLVDQFDVAIEQPFAPGRFDWLAQAKSARPDLKVCFDEEVETLGDLIKLHQLGFVDELNLKVGRVGGVFASLEIIEYCHQHDLLCWVGGMFETGIGRQLNLQVASYLRSAVAHDLSPSARYFVEDIIQPTIEMEAGYVDVAQACQGKVSLELLEKYATACRRFPLTG